MDITTQLAEALQNMMGAFDNPLARQKMNNEFHEECRKSGREALEAYVQFIIASNQSPRSESDEAPSTVQLFFGDD